MIVGAKGYKLDLEMKSVCSGTSTWDLHLVFETVFE